MVGMDEPSFIASKVL